MCNIKTESNVIPEKPKFTLSKKDGMQKLQIVFPEESEELFNIHQSDEYDYSVPDLAVSVDVELLYHAIKILAENPNKLHHLFQVVLAINAFSPILFAKAV